MGIINKPSLQVDISLLQSTTEDQPELQIFLHSHAQQIIGADVYDDAIKQI